MTIFTFLQHLIRHEAQRLTVFGHSRETAIEILTVRGI